MSSSNKINYSIRVNKSIERKIIAEGINTVISKLDFDYQYVGFGSLWFTDFVFFHKVLNIHEMVSMERDRIIFERANFNKPFSCIQLVLGESTEVLQDVLLARKKPAIIWLDYDDNIFQCSSYLSDVDTIINNCQNGSILIVTMNVVNSNVRELKRQAENKEDKDEWISKVKELLKNTFGMVDVDTATGSYLSVPEKFRKLVGPFFEETIQNSIYNSGNQKIHHKIFDFAYADNAEMLTQGFIIFDNDKKEDLSKIMPSKSKYFLNESTFRIEAPILTTREKYSIDQTLPSANIEEFITASGTNVHETITYLESSSLGFPLKIDTLRSYSQLYKFYPTFTEILHT